jgi:phosphoglycerate-specific signal transduction histidine kinase
LNGDLRRRLPLDWLASLQQVQLHDSPSAVLEHYTEIAKIEEILQTTGKIVK